MKKVIFILFLVLIFSLNCFGSDLKKMKALQNSELKRKIELVEKETNTYYGGEIPLSERIFNAEVYVFGVGKSGDLNSRIEKLASSLGVSFSEPKLLDENIDKKIPDSNYLTKKEREPQKSKSQNYVYYSPKTVNYDLSLLNKMEKKLLGKTYEKEDLSPRLSRVERKLFSKDFDYESDLVRLERLKSVQQASKNSTEYKVNKFAKYAIAGAQIGGIVLLILAMIL